MEEDHELPLVYITVHVGIDGDGLDQVRREKLELLGRVWSRAGIRLVSGDSLQHLFAELGVTPKTWSESGTTGISFWMPAGNIDRVLPYASELLFAPRFEEKSVAAALKTIRADRADTSWPPALAQAKVEELLGISGKRPVAPDSAEPAVTAEDLAQFHRELLRQNRVWLGARGDFDRDAISDTVRAWSSRLGAREVGWMPIPEYGDVQPGVFVIDSPDSNVQVRWGRLIPGVGRWSDTFVDNQILAVLLGFGRIFYAVRDKGLGFDSTVYLQPGHDRAWLMSIGSCRLEAVADFVSLFEDEVRGTQTRPPDARELERARLTCLGSALGASQRKRDLLDLKVNYAVRTGDRGALKKYTDQVRKVRLEDLTAILPQYDFRSQSVLVLVGPYASLADRLTGRTLIRIAPGHQ